MILTDLPKGTTLYRAHTPRWADRPMSGAGAALKGGRFNREGVEALYLSLEELTALRSWFKRDIVHLLASDGHSPRRRPPLMAAAYREIATWIGAAAADRICSGNAVTIVNGDRVRVRRPAAAQRKSFWFAKWW